MESNNKKFDMKIKSRFFGKVLFSHEGEKQKSTKGVLEQAVNEGANLEGANLEGAYLRGAYLRGANLEGANLRGANLRGANLRGTGLIQIVGLGSVGRCTTFDTVNQKVICGCFYSTYDEFEERVKTQYQEGNKYRDQYLKALELIKSIEL